MLIDCDSCAGRPAACGDCVINVLLQRPAEPVELDDAECGAFASLADAGLVPPLRLVPVLHLAPGMSGKGRNVAEAG